ncbi:MAG: UPF0182 family protein [Actinomycetota bacterium]|nr:UPF0182 family protein [Actinomycetota bacterium]
MSELFDDDPREEAPDRPSRRSRALVVTAVVLVASFFALTTFASVYTDRLWYRSVGYGQVFSTLLWTKVILFVVFGVLMAAAVAASVFVAYRYRPLFRPQSPEQTNLDRYRDAVTPIRTWLALGAALVVGAFAGASGMGQWRSFLLWRNSQPFEQTDAYFDRDIGFYVFDLPWLHFMVDFLMAATVIALIAGAVVHYLYGGIRLQVTHDRLSGAAQVHLSALLGVFVLVKGADYYLDRFDLVSNDNSLFTGMNYAAENAVLPAKNILMVVAVICAVLFFLNIWRRTWQLPGVGLALLVLSSILLGMIWPAIVQQFQVKPSEADKEASYIKTNIESTRAAYDLTDVETEEYTSGVIQDEEYNQVVSQMESIPLIDPRLVRDTFQQTQQGRAYYSVAPVLDVDRYNLGGDERALVLGVRELDQSGLNDSDKNWSNLHTTYTHGNGMIAAYANQRTADGQERSATTDTAGGGITWAEGLQSGQDALSTLDPEGYEGRIYFGEQSPEYSVVGKASPDAPDVELGLAGADTDREATSTYDGEGGVPVGGTFNQLMYAIKFGEPNFLLSGRVNENSDVLYIRNPHDRVEKVAPWLTVDDDAYPALVDGKIVWILDGYTASDRYPNSQRESFETMTDDTLQEDVGLQTLPTDEINYMRNAVKATVDAYDGTVTLYQWDETDPMLKAWMGAFPDTVVPSSEIGDELRTHLRYPEDLFKVQRYQFARYHVEDASDWYQGNNRWQVPKDPNSNRGDLQPPYRLFANQSGGANAASTWALTTVFTPYERENLASFMSVDSDATSDTYGEMKVLELNNTTTDGPSLIANEFEQDQEVRDALLEFTTGNTPPIFGNLLTLPIEDGFIYIEPVYAVRAGASGGFPILQFVLVSDGNQVGIGGSLTESLKDMLGITGTTEPSEPGEPGEPGEPAGTVDQQISRLLNQAQAAFDAADDALAAGDLALYQERIQSAERFISQAIALDARRDEAEARADGEPTSDASPSEEESPPAG